MVKIVGFDSSAVKRYTCKHCSAILEYTPSDLRKEVHRDYAGGSDTYYILQCPNCNERHHFLRSIGHS